MNKYGVRRLALRAGLTAGAAGAVLGMAGGAAQAAPLDQTTPGGAVTDSLDHATGPVRDLPLNPLAGGAFNPLDNSVGTQVADFKPVSTADVTGPIAGGASLGDLLKR